ncbi:MAG: response regulator [Candidatus Heimdallarchaeota archaeon]|nr:response regulator [Candidatus Heimdallarchaeota archaeon]
MSNITAFHQNRNVLVVDDNMEITLAISRLLSKRYSMFTANSADECRSLLNKREYAVVILDFDLGEETTDGISLSQEVIKFNPYSQIILLTGNLAYDTVKRALNEGNINQFLNKPVETKELIEHVEGSLATYHDKIKITNLLKNPEDLNKIQYFMNDILTQIQSKGDADCVLQGVFIAYDSVPIYSRIKEDLLEQSKEKQLEDGDFSNLFSSFLSALVTLGSEAFINMKGQQLLGFKFQNYHFVFKFNELFQFTYLFHLQNAELEDFEDEITTIHQKILSHILDLQPKRYKALQDKFLDNLIDSYFIITTS